MANNPKYDLADAHRFAVLRYSYFLLAAAGAAIGLAVNQTQSSGLSFAQIPLGVAVLFWGASFLFGCFHNECHREALWQNMWLLEIKDGRAPMIGRNPQLIEVALVDTTEKFDRASKNMKTYGTLQFWLLVLGAVLYLAWHVWQMYLRTA